MGEEKIERIERVEKIDPSRSKGLDIAEGADIATTPSKSKFDSALAKADVDFERTRKAPQVTQPEDVKRASPIEELSLSQNKILRLQPATIDQITSQGNDLRQNLKARTSAIEDTLKANPEAKIQLSPVHEAVLSERLVHIDSSLKTALGKVGVEVKAVDLQTPENKNPLVKFLGYLTHADHQLHTLVSEVNGLGSAGQRLTPEKLLAVQIKISFAQQELEFFTNVLNKALESMKTIMNVQV